MTAHVAGCACVFECTEGGVFRVVTRDPDCPGGDIASPAAAATFVAANKLDEIDATLVEATRLALLAVEVLKGCRDRPPEYPKPSQRAATYLRCAAEILADLGR